MKILIITHSQDAEAAPAVAAALAARGAEPIRFDTDLYPTEVRLTLDATGAQARVLLGTSEGEHDLAELGAVWYRRLQIGGGLPDALDPKLRGPAVEEARRSYLAALAQLDVFMMDPYERLRVAEEKGRQLRLARELGLETPRTLVTNDPEAVRDFAGACKAGMITKMMSSFAVDESGREHVVFTNVVTGEDLAQLEDLRLCPMTFQEKLDKRLELRATVVGDRVFTAAVDSAVERGAELDWRRRGAELVGRWRPYALPAEVEAKLLALTGRFGLQYSAADFIVTPDGRHVFLESNPGGEFLWLDKLAGLPIVQAIADVLLGVRRRRFES